MKALCTLVFACFSFQALACELDALNAAYPIGYFDEFTWASQITIPGTEPLIYSMYGVDGTLARDLQTTASIPAIHPGLAENELYRTTALAPFAY